MSDAVRQPDFLLIGAQKSGTTWLWNKLDQHPETDLPHTKELHYFGGVENYNAGSEPYFAHFAGLDPARLTGEASTSYLYDRIPYWHNTSETIEYEDALPTIPELVAQTLPDVRIIAVLRDPVYRAISAYRHWLKLRHFSPLAGLESAALRFPKTRILEYGNYAQHIAAWQAVFPAEQMLFLLFERDVVGEPAAGLKRVYRFLGLDHAYEPPAPERSVHKSWSWTRSAINYYAGPLRKVLTAGRLGQIIDRYDLLGRLALRRSDIEFLRQTYMPARAELQALIGEDLSCWDYGERILDA